MSQCEGLLLSASLFFPQLELKPLLCLQITKARMFHTPAFALSLVKVIRLLAEVVMLSST